MNQIPILLIGKPGCSKSILAKPHDGFYKGRVQGLGFRVWGLGFRVGGLGLRV